MAFQDLREFLDCLAREQEITVVGAKIDPHLQFSALIKAVGEQAVFAPRVMGSEMALVGNLFGNYRKMELALGVTRERLLATYLERVKNLLPAVTVSNGPVYNNWLAGNEVNLDLLPVPTVNEGDGGPYIDCGIIIAKDPEFGYNLSLQRLQVKGRDRTGIYMHPSQHLATYYRRTQDRGEPLEVAVVIGVDPILYMASQVTGPPELDEYAVAGGLRGEPVNLVRCRTVDLHVPATAEIVLEGIILPDQRELEGPFGEFPGYYGAVDANQLLEIRGIAFRDQAIFQTLYLGKPPTENIYLTSTPKAADLYRLVKECVAEVKDVYLTPGGCGRFHAVVAIKQRTQGEAKLALAAILSSRMAVKHAVVVDDDIDIYNPHEVEWAIATRSQFDRDAVIIEGVPGMLDPSTLAEHGSILTTKVGIDATRPVGVDFAKVADVPAAMIQQVRQRWQELDIDQSGQVRPWRIESNFVKK